jgi:hypothetical protein
MRRFPHRRMILLHYLQMHTAGVFLVGIAVAAVIAIFAISKQTTSLGEDIVISHPPPDDDGS